MPELPEVETLRRGLEKECAGRRIEDVSIANPKVLKGQSEAEFRERAVGKTIAEARRRGKYLLLPLTDGRQTPSPFTLCVHLNMQGSLRLRSAGETLGRYGVLTLELDSVRALHYEDMWGWGEWRVVASDEPSPLPQLGGEPLEPTWDREGFARGLTQRRTAIKTVLLDQKVVAGVGNIYADEALFRARIAPTRQAAHVERAESERLAEAIWQVLTEAVAQGGTRGDYVDLYGQPGRYEPRVYNQAGKPCPDCGTALTKIKLGGRGTTYCAFCQN